MKELTPWLLMAALTVAWMLDRAPALPSADAPPEVVQVDSLLAAMAAGGERWHAFLDRPTLRTGLYVLPEGAEDRQQPHGEDEVYYVLRGRATLTVDGTPHAVEPGTVAFVEAGAAHRFHDIAGGLELLVFFSTAPATPDH